MTYKPLIMIPALITLFALVQGCATMNKNECLTANWYEIGYEDGIKGQRPDRIADHRKACAEHGVSPDLSAYNKGRTEGLPLFCTPHQGYALGLRGRSHNNVCSGALASEFLTAYHQGKEIYRFQKDIDQKEDELADLNRSIQELEKKIQSIEEQMPQKCKDEAECRNLLSRMRRLEREKTDLKVDAGKKEAEIEAMEITLEDMKAGIHM